MAPPRKYPTPAQQLVQLLAVSKRAGLSWEEAWAQATPQVKWPVDTYDRRNWRGAIEATLEEYRAAYLDEPTPISQALTLMSHGREEPAEVRAGPGHRPARVAA
jgi:hypothetical protein